MQEIVQINIIYQLQQTYLAYENQDNIKISVKWESFITKFND